MKVVIDGTEFERRPVKVSVGDDGASAFAWYINGLHVDTKTFHDAFTEASRLRAERHVRQRTNPTTPFRLTKGDIRFMRESHIAVDPEDNPEGY